MANLTILRTYALAAQLPPTVQFAGTERTVTIYDAFPKSLFHLLVLPRPQTNGPSIQDLDSLYSLLRADRIQAHEIIKSLKEGAAEAITEIESEMLRVHGFKWPIWTGFHGAPSMRFVCATFFNLSA